MDEWHWRRVASPRERVFPRLDSLQTLRVFLEFQVHVEWVSMVLLKTLQQRLTGAAQPWRPSLLPGEVMRALNLTVTAEESDRAADGSVMSRYELCLAAMDEIGADTAPARDFVRTQQTWLLPQAVAPFVRRHLWLAGSGSSEEVAVAFLAGRDSVELSPELFSAAVETLRGHTDAYPRLVRYLDRRLMVDDGPARAWPGRLVTHLVGSDGRRRERVEDAFERARELNDRLWDGLLARLDRATA